MSKSNKVQGKKPSTGQKSDKRVSMTPDKSKDRGDGSSFAYAVAAIKEEAKGLKGSQTGFLGEPKETIDLKSYNQSLTK